MWHQQGKSGGSFGFCFSDRSVSAGSEQGTFQVKQKINGQINYGLQVVFQRMSGYLCLK